MRYEQSETAAPRRDLPHSNRIHTVGASACIYTRRAPTRAGPRPDSLVCRTRSRPSRPAVATIVRRLYTAPAAPHAQTAARGACAAPARSRGTQTAVERPIARERVRQVHTERDTTRSAAVFGSCNWSGAHSGFRAVSCWVCGG
jgi:hypothetical protein